jgi:hypothetical protein
MDKRQGSDVADLERAIKLAPGMAFDLFRARHRIPSRRRLRQRDQRTIRRQSAIDPKEPLTYINRGMALLFKEQSDDDAIEDFDRAHSRSAPTTSTD